MLFLHLRPLKKLAYNSGVERGWIVGSLRFPTTLRVLASPKSLTAQVHFVHAQSIEPSPRVRGPTLLKQKMEPWGSTFCFRRERGSNPRSCDRLRFSRPAQSTTLASLRGLVQYRKIPQRLLRDFRFIQSFLSDNDLLGGGNTCTLGPHQVRPAGHSRKAELVGSGRERTLVKAHHLVALQVEHV